MPSISQRKKYLLDIGIFVLCVLLLEGFLRMVPSAIAPALLAHFDPDIRSSIAEKLNLPNKENMISFLDTNNILLKIYRPHATIVDITGEGPTPSVTLDSFGFCNPSDDTGNLAHIDIITLGDSLSWCTAVPAKDTWPSVLGMLTKKSVFNLAVPGTGPDQYVQLLGNFNMARSPRMVILSIFGGNDYIDALRYHTQVEQGNTDNIIRVPIVQKNNYAYNNISYAVNFFVANIEVVWNWMLKKTPADSPSFTIQGPNHTTLSFNQVHYEWIAFDDLSYAKKTLSKENPFDVYSYAVTTFTSQAKIYHFIPVVLYIPPIYSTYREYIRFNDADTAGILDSFDSGQREFLQKQSAALGYIFLDPTDYLQSEADSHRDLSSLLYYQKSLHLTPEGHAAVARFVAAQISDYIK